MLGLLTARPRATLALLVVAAGFAMAGLPRLQIDFTPRDLYGRFAEAARVTQRITEVFGSRDNMVLIMVEAPDVLVPEVLQYVHDVSLRFRLEKFVARVDSITVTRFPRRVSPRPGPAPKQGDTRTLIDHFIAATARHEVRIDAVIEGAEVDAEEAKALRAVLADAPLVNGKLISRDHRVAAVTLALAPDLDRIREVEAVVSEVDGWLATHPPPAGAVVRITGQPHANADFAGRIRADQKHLMPLSLLVCAAVLWFTFGTVAGVLLPLTAVLISAGVLLGGMAWVGEPLNILNNITPLLVIVIGLSDSIHILERYSVERKHGGEARAAVRRTLSALTLACFLTSFTDAIGFGSLWSANTELLARFGITAAIGVMIAYSVTLALVPAWLVIWQPQLAADQRSAARGTARIATLFVLSSRRARRWVLIGASLAVLASLLAAYQVRVDTTMLGLFETDDPIYVATKLAEQELEGVSPLDVIVESPQAQRFRGRDVLAALDAVQHWSEAQPGVLGVSSYSKYLHEVWAVVAEDPGKRRAPFVDQASIDAFDRLLKGSARTLVSAYINDDASQARITIELADIGSREVMALSEALRSVLRRELAAYPDITFALGGNAYVNAHGTNTLTRDSLGSFGQATLAIGLSVLLLSRGLAATFAGVVASVVPQGLVILYMVLRGIPFNAGTVMIFCISVGLAIDGAIHLLARITREERAGGSRAEIMRRAVESTAPGTLMNAVALMLGFSVLTLSQFLPLRQFGELSAVAVFTSLLGTFVLMPSLLDWIGAVRARPAPPGTIQTNHRDPIA